MPENSIETFLVYIGDGLGHPSHGTAHIGGNALLFANWWGNASGSDGCANCPACPPNQTHCVASFGKPTDLPKAAKQIVAEAGPRPRSLRNVLT